MCIRDSSGDREAYEYLARTVERAPGPGTIVARFEEAGLVDVRTEPVLGGAVHLYLGTVPEG